METFADQTQCFVAKLTDTGEFKKNVYNASVQL